MCRSPYSLTRVNAPRFYVLNMVLLLVSVSLPRIEYCQGDALGASATEMQGVVLVATIFIFLILASA